MVKVEAVTEPALLGEGPHWDEEQQVLYFVTLGKSSVIKYDPATKTQTSVRVGTDTRYPSVVIPVEGRRDQFLITLGRSVAVMTWDGVSSEPAKVETLCSVHERGDEQEHKFNDGKVDHTGRFWAGTLGEVTMSLEAKTKGCLFSFSKNWVPSVHLTDVSISNGMAWSADQKTMYYIDSLLRRVDALDFNSETGELSNRRVVFDFKKNNLPDDSFPDGMTIDTEGKLWVACFWGGQVIRVDPTSGKLVGSVSVPVPQVTSVAFGGPNLDELYITSGNMKLSDKDDCDLKYAGCTFRVTGVGAKGFPAKKAQLA